LKEIALAACFACHGAGGVSQTPLTPSIAAQPAFYVVAQLFLFREGRRDSKEMVEAAKGLSDDELRALGDALSSLRPPPPPPPANRPDGARFSRGRALAQKERCGTCHEADYAGRENMPRLANQREDYLLKALRDYRKGVRVGYGNAVMPELVSQLRDADLQDLAHFLYHFRR
jgi:cytochrome c553